ncbi:hypothetical protein [Glutamicibacter arilaitensis]|uniref:hypothetical protein n=1 Tax=Glutamicibacter arilaitensis TaxID=256701 RepID=UPI003FD01636
MISRLGFEITVLSHLALDFIHDLLHFANVSIEPVDALGNSMNDISTDYSIGPRQRGRMSLEREEAELDSVDDTFRNRNNAALRFLAW